METESESIQRILQEQSQVDQQTSGQTDPSQPRTLLTYMPDTEHAPKDTGQGMENYVVTNGTNGLVAHSYCSRADVKLTVLSQMCLRHWQLLLRRQRLVVQVMRKLWDLAVVKREKQWHKRTFKPWLFLGIAVTVGFNGAKRRHATANTAKKVQNNSSHAAFLENTGMKVLCGRGTSTWEFAMSITGVHGLYTLSARMFAVELMVLSYHSLALGMDQKDSAEGLLHVLAGGDRGIKLALANPGFFVTVATHGRSVSTAWWTDIRARLEELPGDRWKTRGCKHLHAKPKDLIDTIESFGTCIECEVTIQALREGTAKTPQDGMGLVVEVVGKMQWEEGNSTTAPESERAVRRSTKWSWSRKPTYRDGADVEMQATEREGSA
ncbi:hypothetical protein BKA62DRAFT_673890 [Auriculariales sp. MPI-PUGE-AT-0066]|nr:hypothetical protein BKA62DRAFT_673890 [Auriculariales sp. MPI-PUGE-AT-0066]